MAAAEGLFVVETFTDKPAPSAMPHAFANSTVELSPGVPKQIHFTIPRLEQMDELVVDRASLTLAGEGDDLEPVALQSPASSAAHKLKLPSGKTGALRRVRIEGLSIKPSHSAYLASSGQGTAFSWSVGSGNEVSFGTNVTGDMWVMHFVVYPLVKPGVYGTPAAAAPLYDQINPPPGAGHVPLLGGATVTLQTPASNAKTGTLTIDFNPPIAAPDVQMSILAHDLKEDSVPSPFTGTRIHWGAAKVIATWATAPQGLELGVVASTGAPAIVAAEGELGRAMSVDFTPAARATLSDLYQQAAPGDLKLTLEAKAQSIGTLRVNAPAMTLRYYRRPVPVEGEPVALRGAPATVHLKVPPGLRPSGFTWTVDGRFGRNLLVSSSDAGLGKPRKGWQLGAALWVARRMALTGAERAQPLSRVSLFGRATGATELLISFHDGDDRHIGDARGKPVALAVAPSSSPDWCRAEIADGLVPPPHPQAVWVVARASRGVFSWYGAPADPEPSLISTDEGASWANAEGGPGLQLHVATEPEAASLLVFRPDGTVIAKDVLAAQVGSLRSKVQLSRLQAAQLGVLKDATQVDPAGVAMFRKEGLTLLSPAEVAAAKGDLVLVFTCARDADFRILAAELTYDPWLAKGSG